MMKRKIITILVSAIALTVCLCGCGETEAEKQVTIEDQADVSTETIGSVGYCLPTTSMPANTENVSFGDDEDEAAVARLMYEEGGKLFDLMENSDASYFYIDSVEYGWSESEGSFFLDEDDKGDVVQCNKEEFAQHTRAKSTENVDAIMEAIGADVECFLNQNAKSIQSPYEFGAGMFGGNKTWSTYCSSLALGFDGEEPDEYFEKRNLALSCKSLTAKKIAVMTDKSVEGITGNQVDAYFIVFDADVLTESCNGDSVFPPEGETGTVHFMIGVNEDDLNVCYCSIYFR